MHSPLNLIYLVFLMALPVLRLATFVSILVAPFVAKRKGYAPYYWLFACGPIGLVIVCWLPSLRTAETPEQYEQMEARANLIGSILTGIALFLSVGLISLAMIIG
ncbi:MAG: hypothetical protein AABP62_04855 [Planctomycetota bacterium]